MLLLVLRLVSIYFLESDHALHIGMLRISPVTLRVSIISQGDKVTNRNLPTVGFQ